MIDKVTLSTAPARTDLTDRECAKLIGSFIGSLCDIAPVENVERALQWWAQHPEAWEYLRASMAAVKATADSVAASVRGGSGS